MGRVRAFSEEDIPQVADIHRRGFQLAGEASPELSGAYRHWLTQVFLSNPWRDESLASLVYESEPGKVKGFLGITLQRMQWNGRPVKTAIMSNFVVDADSRGLAGISLLRALFAGPQDLTITDEANGDVRRIWQSLGGATSFPDSMHWYYPLRPCQFAALGARKKSLTPGFLSRMSFPAARALDAVVTWVADFSLPKPDPRLSPRGLDPQTLAACLWESTQDQTLRPDYDPPRLDWILQRAAHMQTNGSLRQIVVMSEDQNVAGWYLYYANPGGIGQVIQFRAKPQLTGAVLDHLLNDAWQRGVVVLSGRPERNLTQILSERHCIFACGPDWTLIHSRTPEIVDAFHRGDAFFSRLEGEWYTHFR
ncbi:MAG TPA: hypothetical protein VFY29_04860 [Terriglobia bacterium]|nr:hypothetical protein [Terriglobia bacterium]